VSAKDLSQIDMVAIIIKNEVLGIVRVYKLMNNKMTWGSGSAVDVKRSCCLKLTQKWFNGSCIEN
jgi:hypothetical protein